MEKHFFRAYYVCQILTGSQIASYIGGGGGKEGCKETKHD